MSFKEASWRSAGGVDPSCRSFGARIVQMPTPGTNLSLPAEAKALRLSLWASAPVFSSSSNKHDQPGYVKRKQDPRGDGAVAIMFIGILLSRPPCPCSVVELMNWIQWLTDLNFQTLSELLPKRDILVAIRQPDSLS